MEPARKAASLVKKLAQDLFARAFEPVNSKMPLAVFSVTCVLFSTVSYVNTEQPESHLPRTEPASAEHPLTTELVTTAPAEEAPLKTASAVAGPAPEPAAWRETPTVIAPPESGRSTITDETAAEPTPGWTPADFTRGPAGGSSVSLTFDGGYKGAEASLILDTLRERGVKTTIFLTGVFIELYPEITRRIVVDGHEVGNHLMNHPHLTSYSTDYTQTTLPEVDREFIARELRETERLFREVTGAEMAPLWRAPYGEVNREIRRWAFEAGYVHVGWTNVYSRRESLDTLDWVSDPGSELYLTSAEIKNKVVGFGEDEEGPGGGIVLMHMGTARTTDRAVDVLGEIIEEMRDRGYRFVTASGLLEEKAEGRRALEAARRIRDRKVADGGTTEGPGKG